jgi:pullulanase/glycogen debranching enzyme
VAFFAPKESYSSRRGLGAQVLEFKEMVSELHAVDGPRRKTASDEK